MIRSLYNWTMRLGESRYALLALAAVAFVESSVFPIPPDVLLIPMVLALPGRAFFIAFVAALSSVLGGMFGYYIGAALMDGLGMRILEFYHATAQFDTLKAAYNAQGVWAILIAGVTPFPFKVITILSGATHLNFGVFVASAIVARALRFFIVAALLWKFGAAIRDFIERRLGLVFAVALALLVGGFAAVKYL